MDTQLIGISLVGETESSNTHIVGALHRPSPSEKLSDFRNVVRSALPLSISSKAYTFVTPSGWEINEALERTVTTSNVITSDGIIKIRLCYPKPRIGVVIEGSPAFPIGFVFCSLDSTVRDFLDEIERQLPLLQQSFPSGKVCFLDRNGWPVGKDQECLLTLLDIVSDHTVRVHATVQQNLPSQARTGRFPELTLPFRPTSPLVVPTTFSSAAPSDRIADLPDISEPGEKQEKSNLEQSLSSEMYFDSMKLSLASGSYGYEVLISYVHSEASDYALGLKNALEKRGYSVFLDTFCIRGGVDWQDALNVSITNCSLFVPLITSQYGETLWTNREVKLADVLGKIIIPVNFLPSWPPKCLGIQFATTQYVAWKKSHSDIPESSKSDEAEGEDVEGEDVEEEDVEEIAASVADEIAVRYKAEVELEDVGVQDAEQAKSSVNPPIPKFMRKASSLKSYADVLPDSLPALYRKSIQGSRQGRPLVVISCHSAQKEIVQDLNLELEAKGFEVWCSDSVDTSDSEKARQVFQAKADEAGVVILVISSDFVNSSFCEQQVYYCEQRKRIIPLICDAIQLPHRLSMLIGTSTFVDSRAARYKSTLVDRIEAALNPMKAEQDLKALLKQKAQVAQMCSDLASKLPKGKHVYISGGTTFFSPCGEEICKELGRQLAQHPDINVVTGGFFGVGDTVARSFLDERLKLNLPHGVCHVVAVRDDQDKSHQTTQNPDGTFPPVSYGDTLFFGDSVRQREMLTPRVLDLCILIEGGPGAAFEAQQFCWNGNQVIPVKATGGAAGGLFNVPQSIFNRPVYVNESDWSILADKEASPPDIAAALLRIVRTLTLDPSTPRMKRRNTGVHQESKTKFRRSDTMLVDDKLPGSKKRAFSEGSSSALTSKQHC